MVSANDLQNLNLFMLAKKKKNVDVILQFQSLLRLLLGIIFAKVNMILC